MAETDVIRKIKRRPLMKEFGYLTLVFDVSLSRFKKIALLSRLTRIAYKIGGILKKVLF